MVILVAKSTDAHLEEVKRGVSAVWRRAGLAVVRVGSGGHVCAGNSLSLSLVVLSANLIVALIISVFGFHFSKGPSFWGPDQPPNRYEGSPHLGPANWRISRLMSRSEGGILRTPMVGLRSCHNTHGCGWCLIDYISLSTPASPAGPTMRLSYNESITWQQRKICAGASSGVTS